MRNLIIIGFLLLGCSTEKKTSEIDFPAPEPVLIRLNNGEDTIELRGRSFLEVMEEGPVRLRMAASAENMSIDFSIELTDKWAKDPLQLATDIRVDENTRSQMALGEEPSTGKMHAVISDGQVSGSVDITSMKGDKYSGDFDGKLSLMCGRLSSSLPSEETGGGPTNGGASWSIDTEQTSEFCQSVLKAFGI